jgi:hypothetical protein
LGEELEVLESNLEGRGLNLVLAVGSDKRRKSLFDITEEGYGKIKCPM